MHYLLITDIAHIVHTIDVKNIHLKIKNIKIHVFYPKIKNMKKTYKKTLSVFY